MTNANFFVSTATKEVEEDKTWLNVEKSGLAMLAARSFSLLLLLLLLISCYLAVCGASS